MRGLCCLGRFVLAGTALIAGADRSFALDPQKSIRQYVRHAWGTDQGLPQDTVSGIVQSDDGYLWIGTRDGLARFDGARFTLFNRLNTPGMRSNLITTLRKGRDGTIWAGTDEGLIRYKDGLFSTFNTRDGFPGNYVLSISIDADGVVWVATSGGVVRLVDGETRVEQVEGMPAGLLGNLTHDSKGTLWFSRAREIFRRAGGVVLPVPLVGPPDQNVNQMHEDSGGTLWIAATGGIFKFVDGAYIMFAPTATPARTVIVDRDGVPWAGFEGGGVGRYVNGSWEFFTSRDGLTDDIVQHLFEDHERTVWVAPAAAA